MGRIKKPHWSPVAYSLLNGKHRTGLYMRSTVFTVFLVFEKSKKKNFVDKNLPCLWKIFSVYEMSYLWNVLSMKFPIYEMSVYEMSVYEMSVYEMSFYEMSYLWNVLFYEMSYLSNVFLWNVFLWNVQTPVELGLST